MLGTFARVLGGKKIRTLRDLFQATVIGDIEDVDGVLKITRIQVDYQLKAPEDKHKDAKEALYSYLHLCPAAQSVIGCIDINHSLTIESYQ
jgi:hypothetical protein